MSGSIPTTFLRSLRELRERGEPVRIADLARHLLVLKGTVEAGLARRLVATALGRAPQELPDPLKPRHLRPSCEADVDALHVASAEFTVVDLETTGVCAKRCAILEIGAVRVARLEPVARFQTLVRPPRAVPRRIVDLTGIDAAMLADAPAPPTALASFWRWLAHSPRAPFVAHNAQFDARFVARGFASASLPARDVPVLCTRRLARRILPRLGRYDLDHLCAHFGIRNGARHRALGDAEATARALIELLHLARGGHGVETLGDLLDLQERSPGRGRDRRRAPLRRTLDRVDRAPRR